MRRVLSLATATAIGLAHAAQSSAQAMSSTASESSTGVASDKDVVVVGIRGAVETATKKKKKAKQIVDSVVSEDAGKLPDNNVVEALARVTGVNITRAQGGGNGLTIRGLDGVQTTVNGAEVGSAGSRTLSLSDIPAELVKSIDVYKTRTADQVEGGIGGTVNVELRRPLDLKKGLTLAGSFRESYNSQGSTWSPFASVLVGERFDTGIGEIGFLVNGGYQNVAYNEPYITSESPFYFYNRNNSQDTFRSRLYNSLPAAVRDTAVAPYRATYGLDEGRRKLPSLNGVLQWKPSDRLNFVLEGSYLGNRSTNQYNALYVKMREDGFTYENPVFSPSGALKTVTVVNDNPVANFVGIVGGQNKYREDTYHTNFETHWNAPGVRIDASAQYDWSNSRFFSVGYEGQLNGLSRVGVDLTSGAAFDFSGTDITKAESQRIFSLSDNIGSSKSSQFAAQADMSLDVSPTGLLRNIQIGTRYRQSSNQDQSSYRYANWGDPETRPLLTALPGVGLRTVTPGVNGAQAINWIQLNSADLYNNWPAVTQFIVANNPGFLDGPGRDEGVASLFATARPSAADPTYTGSVKENVFSAYGTLNYAFKAGFPIDGQAGLRYVNTFGSFGGNSLRLGAADPANPGSFLPNTVIRDNARANYVDLLPSVFGIVHFTSQLQLRASYNHNVQRPPLQALRAYRQLLEANNPFGTIYGGNPDLKPTTSNDFNISLEHYFGRGGIISVTGFLKKQKGFIYETRQLEPVPELGNTLRYVRKPRNAGPGETKGVEFQATSFFSFLPGALRNFGATVNGTWIPDASLSLPFEADAENNPGVISLVKQFAPYTSKLSYNLIGYYETSKFSARVAYNWRSRFVTGVDAVDRTYITSSPGNSRLDAALNITPVPFITLSVEGTNLTNKTDTYYYTIFPDLQQGFRQMGRTIQLSARFRM
ncbi:MAG: TonB-dependent receptor [Sphingomonas phyllosphaerae]|uniref:TonB-dependent receptor n=1 Tax=Sphingomonas phyllosphaerae TaxID=257003 RepID=UPI002FF9F029